MSYPVDPDALAEQIKHITGQDHDRIPLPSPQDDEPEAMVSITQKMLSAVSGSVLTSLLVTPLDVVRVRLQSQIPPSISPSSSAGSKLPSTLPMNPSFEKLPPNLGISQCCREVFWINNNAAYCVAGPSVSAINDTAVTASGECAVEETSRRTFTSTLDGLQKIARNEGPKTLWRGLTPTLAMAVPGNVIYFAGYDWLRSSRASPLVKFRVNDDYAPLAAGSVARVLAAIVVSPIEMFRTRMQAASSTTSTASVFRSTIKDMSELVQERGYRSLWTGLTLTLWRDVPFSAIYWWGYETGRNMLTDMRSQARGRESTQRGRGSEAVRMRTRSRSRENHTATLFDSFIAGAVSGAVAAFVTTPFDVGKTRQQIVRHANMSGGAATKVASLPEEQTMPRFLMHIYREQGMKGLFRGWVPRVAKVAPACAIMISSYEVGKKMAGGINERRDKRLDD